jgi:signal transduction histidine kinase
MAAAGVAVPAFLAHEAGAGRLTTAGASEMFLVAMVSGYARRLFGEAEQRASLVLHRLRGLNEANTLLLQLNLVAQTLPASLDLEETLRSTVEQLQSMLRPDLAAVLLWDVSLGRWSLGAGEGTRFPPIANESDLPAPVKRVARAALRDRSAVLADLSVDGPGLGSASRCGIYAALVARRTLVGVLVVESHDPTGLAAADLPLMTGLAEQAALAIDNAQWFGRLRTVGAEEERTRIARDLHDRVAQSLAYLAFELDRITNVAKTEPVTHQLDALRNDVRQVVTDVRDTLYDLRTNVTETQDLVDTLDTFLQRVRARTGIDVRFTHRVRRRLPVPVERELWRIAQEAVTNAERHARASQITVVWEAYAGHAHLDVVDDGRGFPIGMSGRLDSYGLLGMRERADAIGASLEIESTPGEGTAIRCRLEVP